MPRITRRSVALADSAEITADRGISMSPQGRKRMKRSASAITHALLPTPPRTSRKKSYLRSGSTGRPGKGNGTALESTTEEDEEDAAEQRKAKRRRIEDSRVADDPFMSLSEATASAPVYIPVSPPVSRRSITTCKPHPFPVAPSTPRRSPIATLPPMTPSPPMTTPPRRTPRFRRDSLANPFLISPTITIGSEDEDRLPLPEKPTVDYVFRGVKNRFANPHYNAQPSPESQLPIEHPDYEAPEGLGVRRLLFKSARVRRSNATTTKMIAK